MKKEPACLRCRSRKTRCSGPSNNPQGCAQCASAGEICEVVPHRRGRKQGTRLSDSVRAQLKQKYASKARRWEHKQDSGSRRSSRNVDSHEERPSVLYSTSTVRMNPHEADLGPSIQRISSIARLFKPRRIEGKGKGPDLALYREDPITCGFISEGTGAELFKHFMENIATKLFIFDLDLHTYDYVRFSSSFLFCVILAVAAKFHRGVDPVTHKKCLALAKDHMLRVFADDVKTEETIQALFVLTEYKEVEDENGYMLLGMACRLADELELAEPRADYDQRQNRSRERIWLALYAADKRYNYCGQTSKFSMMPNQPLSRLSSHFTQSSLCTEHDHRLAINVALRYLLAKHIDAIDQDNERGAERYALDLRERYFNLVFEVDDWIREQCHDSQEASIHSLIPATLAKVLIAHRWVQRAFRTVAYPSDERERERREALSACIEGSLEILRLMLDVEEPDLRYACDSKHLYFAYASFFLYKAFDMKIATIMLDHETLSDIFDLFERCAIKLEDAALSPSHTIAYHASFLRSLAAFNTMTPVEGRAIIGETHSEPHNTTAPFDQPIFSSTPPPSSSNNASQINDTLPLPPLAALDEGPSERGISEFLGNNVSWDDWWPFSDVAWSQEGLIDTTQDESYWQGYIHTT